MTLPFCNVLRMPTVAKAVRFDGTPEMGAQIVDWLVSKGTLDQLRELLSGDGITQVLVGDAWSNTAKQGQTTTLARAWGKHIAMLYLNPLASVEQGGITFGFTAQYGDRLAGRIEDPDIGLQGGFRIRTGERVRELISAQDVGYFVQNAVV